MKSNKFNPIPLRDPPSGFEPAAFGRRCRAIRGCVEHSLAANFQVIGMNLSQSLLRLAGVVVFAIASAGLRADPPPDAPAPPPIAAPRADAAGGPARDASGPAPAETSAMISAGLPKYSPPKPAPPPKPESELPDLRDMDKPKNEIIRLPKFVVRAAKAPIFREKDVYTAQGLADLAVRRYLSEFDRSLLSQVTLPLFGVSPEARALARYEEDQRLEQRGEPQRHGGRDRPGRGQLGKRLHQEARPRTPTCGRSTGAARCRSPRSKPRDGPRECHPARTAGPGAGLGFGRGPRREARREPGGRLAPHGEAARPGLRVRGAAGARVPAGGAARGTARGPHRAPAQAAAPGLHAARPGRDRQHERRGGPPACRRPRGPVRGPRAAADERAGAASGGPGTARTTATCTQASRSARACRPTGCRPSRFGWASTSAS